MPPSRVQRIQDSVHGLMEFRGIETLVVQVLRTKEVQRLRRVRQLGLVHLVFPGGEHSRLVHSLGAAYLAVLLGRRLSEACRDTYSSHLLPDETAVRDFALAALFHDLGHGPLSHAWEREIIGEGYDQNAWRAGLGLPDDPLLQRPLKWHVLVGQAFLARPDGELHRALESYEQGTSERLRAFLLGGYHLRYLPRLLDSDVDVDRGDFLKRDGQQCGVTFGEYDFPRLVSTCTLGETANGQLVAGFEGGKALRVVEQFLIARRAMYDAVYHHRTVRSAEGMVALFLRRLRTVTRGGGRAVGQLGDRIVQPLIKMVEGKVVGPGELLSADDFSLQVLINSVADDNDADPVARDLAGRILSRNLFKVVPRTPEQLADYFQREDAYQSIHTALRECGFADPEYYRVVDKAKFRMLADREEEWSYFVAPGGRATPVREHESIRPVWDRQYENLRLFVPEEALERVTKAVTSRG